MNSEFLLGKKIRELRKSLGFTQEQFAEKINMDYKYLSKIENGLHIPTYKTIKKIADALQTNLDFFEIPQLNSEKNFNSSYLKAIKILNSAKNEKEYDYYFEVLKLAQKGINL